MWFWLWCHRSLVSFAAAFEDELKLESCPPRNASISCNIYLYSYIYIHIYLQLIFIEGSLEVKLPTIWTDEKVEVGRVKEEKRRRKKIGEEKGTVAQWRAPRRIQSRIQKARRVNVQEVNSRTLRAHTNGSLQLASKNFPAIFAE